MFLLRRQLLELLCLKKWMLFLQQLLLSLGQGLPGMLLEVYILQRCE